MLHPEACQAALAALLLRVIRPDVDPGPVFDTAGKLLKRMHERCPARKLCGVVRDGAKEIGACAGRECHGCDRTGCPTAESDFGIKPLQRRLARETPGRSDL